MEKGDGVGGCREEFWAAQLPGTEGPLKPPGPDWGTAGPRPLFGASN